MMHRIPGSIRSVLGSGRMIGLGSRCQEGWVDVRLDRQTGRSVGEGLVMGAKLLGMGEEGWSTGDSGVL